MQPGSGRSVTKFRFTIVQRRALGATLGSVPAVEVLVPVLKHKPANRRFILFILCTLFILLLVLLVLLVLL